MSNKRHHAEWLSLIEVSGPFLTMPVLEKVFPQGLDAHDADAYRNLRLAFEEWEEAPERPALHRAWVKYVLQQTLGLPDEVLAEGQSIPETIKATVAEQGETLRPDFLVRNPEDVPDPGKTRLLIQVYPTEQGLEKPVAGRHWKASPATRMMELLHAVDVKLGLVTNGEHWMLVYAPRGETTGFASWYASLWLEEKLTLQAFISLLGVRRFFAVPDGETLEAMLGESAKHQQEVTDQLGYQVRRAVEVLIHSLDRADQDHGRALLAKVPEAELYESALTVMMRLVFLFCAEERDLLLLDDPMYDQNYAVSTLVAQLQEAADQHGEEVLERRLDAWVRLLATFRAVFGGVEHERMKLPAYGGNLFNPDRFPFLEGRPAGSHWRETAAAPLPVNNRTVLHLLRSLQYLEMQGEARRLSFRALDIEQIGHVYEGLLDHTARRAAEPVLGLVGPRGDEPEIALSELERLRAKGDDDLLTYLKDQTQKSENTLRRLLSAELESRELDRLRAACGNDEALFKRVRPFAGLIRPDSFDRPVVIPKGSVYVTAGTDRRSSGTHYTPKSLTEPIVQYTLEPLVYVGPAEGKPKEEWQLRSPRELLELKICDMACGSGAFLVQACRYLSERLVEAWEELVGGGQPSVAGSLPHESSPKNIASESPFTDHQSPTTDHQLPGITPFGEPATGAAGESLIPAEPEERMAFARRIVAQRCLYGVDKNPLAVEMAKLSLWLLTLAKAKPFTFLDHAIRCGDSLIGLHHLDQIRYFTFDLENKQRSYFADAIERVTDEVIALRQRIEASPSERVEDVETQQHLLAEAEAKTAQLRCAADLLLAAEMRAVNAKQKEVWRNDAALQAKMFIEQHSVEEFQAAARKELAGQQTFHWPLEFPEVFVTKGGFDVFIGNPPYRHGSRISTDNGSHYLAWLLTSNKGIKGTVDLVVYFLRRAFSLSKIQGLLGLIVTKSIAEGDNKDHGLSYLISTGHATLVMAERARHWPGTASVKVALIVVAKTQWSGVVILEGKQVTSISSDLSGVSDTDIAFELSSNQSICFKGSELLGDGFVISRSLATELLSCGPEYAQIIKPLLNGQEFVSDHVQAPTRWVIDFFDLDESQARSYTSAFEIVERLVKPTRANDNRQARRERYWRFGEIARGLYDRLSSCEKALAKLFTGEYWFWDYVKPGIVYTNALVIVARDVPADFAIFSSSFHEVWARLQGSSLETRPRYTPSRCFDTFPFPERTNGLGEVGEHYHAHRQSIMLARQEGLTKTYNRFHNPEESAADIVRLRELHQQMDEAVAAAYGWTDLRLGHDFHETKQGVRFTLQEAARREVLDRLLELNHRRYAEEVAEGLHEKKGGRRKAEGGKRKKSRSSAADSGLRPEQEALFELDDQQKLFK